MKSEEFATARDGRLRPAIDIKTMKNPDLIDHIKTLIDLRKKLEPLKTGLYEEVQVRNETLVFARVLNDDFVIVALNNTADTKHLSFDYRGQHFDVELPPHGSKLLK